MCDRLRGYRVLMAFSFQAAPREAALFLLAGAAMALIGPSLAVGAKLLVDGAVGGDARAAGLAALLLAASAALGLIATLYYIDFLFAVAEAAGAAVDRRLMALIAGVTGLEHHERPDYLDRLDVLREERWALAWMTNATAGLLRVAVQLAASAVLLARLDPVLLLLPLVGVVSFAVNRRAQALQERAIQATAEPERLRRQLFELATAASAGKEARLYGLGDDLSGRHWAASEHAIRERDRADWQAAGLRSIDAVVSGAAYVAAIGLTLALAIGGSATPGDVVLAVGLASGMNAIVFTAVAYGASFLRSLRVAGRYLWLEDYAADARVVPVDPAPAPARLVDGIDVRDLTFAYPGAAEPVLTSASLRLPAGSVVALVGENGAGKTTLVKLLCRYYEPTAGQLLVDGVDLRRIDPGAWRGRLAAAFQDFARFELTAGETVGVGDLPRLDDEGAVMAALARAGAADLPTVLPGGLATPLGRAWEGGAELSGGQWQKLALGRSMMRDRPLLLILDEPTASLDAQAEHDLFERYALAARAGAAGTGAITMLVSHRFSTVRMADLIVVIDGGRVVERGSHADLMARGGLYAELYELQARAYR